jgi:uncharacterized protein YbjT (DUF2867 family)
MYVILGATGNTGSVVANKLLDKGKKVRVFGRDSKKLAPFVNRGAEAAVGEVTDAAALGKVFAGAEAVYAMIPPNMTTTDFRALQDKTTEAIASAMEASGVRNVVALSSVGADKGEKTGPVVGLNYLEMRLGKIKDLNALHLRAGYFMENTLAQIGIIQNFGMTAGPLRADLPLPMIATKDIGEFAANALLALDFKGQQTQELLGQRDVTYTQVAKIVGAAIGKPALAYVQLPNEQVIQAMASMGISRNVATLICEMSDSINSGYMRALEARSPKNTTPTTFESFVREVFVPAFSGKAASA